MKSARHLFVLFVVLALHACASAGTKVDQDKLSQFVKGKTTYAEVVEKLGKPIQNTVNPDGTRIVAYAHQRQQTNAATFIPVVNLFFGGAEWENTTVVFTFNKNNILTDYSTTTSEGGVQMKTGR